MSGDVLAGTAVRAAQRRALDARPAAPPFGPRAHSAHGRPPPSRAVRDSAARPRASRRVAQSSVQEAIAQSRAELDSARLLTLSAAHAIDAVGSRAAAQQIALIKLAAPRAACTVIDRAVQIFGGAGVSEDFELAAAYAAARTLRLADGPDEVHARTVARAELLKARL